jgi:hypothetical protein
MAISQETIVLNDFGFTEKRRTTSKGTKSRFTVSIKADPIVHVFDAKALGRGPAEAIAAVITSKIKKIGEFATPATVAFRARAVIALARGDVWAQRRYSGGRTGPKPPNQTKRLFNDSGRLAEGIAAGPTSGNEWVINVPSNRFDPSTFKGGVAALTAMVNRLQSLVPELRAPEELAKSPEVHDAIRDSIYDVIITGNERLAKQGAALRRAIGAQKWAIVRQIAGGIGLL